MFSIQSDCEFHTCEAHLHMKDETQNTASSETCRLPHLDISMPYLLLPVLKIRFLRASCSAPLPPETLARQFRARVIDCSDGGEVARIAKTLPVWGRGIASTSVPLRANHRPLPLRQSRNKRANAFEGHLDHQIPPSVLLPDYGDHLHDFLIQTHGDIDTFWGCDTSSIGQGALS